MGVAPYCLAFFLTVAFTVSLKVSAGNLKVVVLYHAVEVVFLTVRLKQKFSELGGGGLGHTV